MSEATHTNRLIDQTSPYLLQHAHNPVDWYPWCEEALEEAERRDRPILLSIGYAACHWCHVMERESFEDEETAALMNDLFVSIKVDREERPDLDAIYMDAVQAMTGHGGWPLTAFLTPDGRPFYAGTYFPNEDRHGMPAFPNVLRAVAGAWRDSRDDVVEQGRRVVEGIGKVSQLPASQLDLSQDVLRAALEALASVFDPRWGGFGSAPKFPQPMVLEFLLRCHLRGWSDASELLTTLDRMAAGGMHDQVGGGFHRYSVDGRWHVPHFEKMLYDNAQLARLYLRAWQSSGRDPYRDVAVRTLEYLLREMRHEGGGFFSSQDADSEGVEGKFFVWSYEELEEVAGDEVAACLGAMPDGNWEGTNVLWLPVPVGVVAAEFGIGEEELERRIGGARDELFRRREGRIRPATDDKILAGWNAMAISALAEAGRVLAEPRYIDAAVVAADFVLTELRRDDGRLLRAWREGRTAAPAYADDYALMADACLTLYETTFELRFFKQAQSLCDDLIRLFHDEERGGFFQTGADAEELVVRPKELFDNAVPAGNSVAAEVLLRLSSLTGERPYEDAALSALRLVRDFLAPSPTGFGQALSALDRALSPSREIAIVGELDAQDTRALAAVVWERLLPNRVLAVASPSDPEARETVALLERRVEVDGRPTAYVCEGFACKLPVNDPDDLAAQLGP